MLKKNILRNLPGIIFASVLVISVMLPVKAAVTRATTYKWNKGYSQTSGNLGRSVTEGGSAYDDRGYACNAKLVAGVIPRDSISGYGYFNFTGSTTGKAYSPYMDNVLLYTHDCEAR